MQMLQLAAATAVSIVVTRATGATGKGIYTLMGTVLTLTTLATGLGISWAGIYHLGKRTHDSGETVGTLLAAGLASSAVSVIGIALAYAALRGSYFRAVAPEQLWLTLALVPAVQMAGVAGAILLGFNRPIHFAFITPVQVLVTVVGDLSLLLFGRLTVTTAIAAWLIGALSSVTVALVLVQRNAPVRLRLHRPVLKSLVVYGSKGYIANLSSFFNYRLDSLILNGFAGVAAVGFYSIAVAAAELIWYVSNSVSQVLFPHISNVDRAEANRITPIICRNTLFASLVAAAAMFLVSRTLIVGLYSAAMLPAVQPLWLLLPGIVALSVGKVIASYLSGVGKPIYASYIAAGTLVCTVALDVLLIPRYGASGAAVASSIAYTVATLASLWAFRRESGSSLRAALILRGEDLDRYGRLFKAALSRLDARPITP
jgi:O-antigen/teichoic acid export membrane protein